MGRRSFALTRRSLVAGGLLLPMLKARQAPAVVVADRPQVTSGVQSGDVSDRRAVIWARADRPSRMIVDVATTESMADARRLVGPAALEVTDFTAKLAWRDLPPGQTIVYRVSFEDLANPGVTSEPVTGRFRTPGADDVSFVWSGDTAGQGWGIDEGRGGMRTYDTMRRHEPDFFIHSGDTIYADGPLAPEVVLEDGSIWRNLMIAEKEKVAETLAEFHGNHRYNLMDANVRALAAEVPILPQWDDHDVVDNWYPDEMLRGDDRYTVTSANLLAAHGRQAFFDYMPIRPDAGGRIHRQIRRGPLLDIFALDMRSHRAANGPNRQETASDETAFLGQAQVDWLKHALLRSRATWKVIAADMALGLVVRDGPDAFDNAANGDGPALGRELEIAALLRFIRDRGIANVVWLTADVHYTAAHHYDPARARFTEFAPFWEFVSGPLNAGTFGPNTLDDTFGPRVVFQKTAPEGRLNQPPSAGLQFFGHVRIAAASGVMTVTLRDVDDNALWSIDLEPERT